MRASTTRPRGGERAAGPDSNASSPPSSPRTRVSNQPATPGPPPRAGTGLLRVARPTEDKRLGRGAPRRPKRTTRGRRAAPAPSPCHCGAGDSDSSPAAGNRRVSQDPRTVAGPCPPPQTRSTTSTSGLPRSCGRPRPDRRLPSSLRAVRDAFVAAWHPWRKSRTGGPRGMGCDRDPGGTPIAATPPASSTRPHLDPEIRATLTRSPSCRWPAEVLLLTQLTDASWPTWLARSASAARRRAAPATATRSSR